MQTELSKAEAATVRGGGAAGGRAGGFKGRTALLLNSREPGPHVPLATRHARHLHRRLRV